MLIDIRGLSKLELLKRLVLYSQTNFTRYIFNEEQAKVVLARGYIDYFAGRAIKCDLTQDKVDPALYNRDAGEGVFEKIVQQMREE